MRLFEYKAGSITLVIVGMALIVFGIFFGHNVYQIALQTNITNAEASISLN